MGDRKGSIRSDPSPLFPLTETESVNCISIYYSIVSP